MASSLEHLPPPHDDGAAEHLPGLPMPSLGLAATAGGDVDLAQAARTTLVLYLYPRTSGPGVELPEGWDEIPGAFGCTAESCGFRDHAEDLVRLGATVHGLSAQPLAEVQEFAQRERIPYPVLSDPALTLADHLGLPTFEAGGLRLYRRLTLIARAGRIEEAIYPVFPPDTHAAEVLERLGGR